jgi:hypothetical protein
LLPRVDVFDPTGNAVRFTLLANENGNFSVEVPNVPSGGSYYVKVSAQSPGAGRDSGSYFLGVDFDAQAATTLTNFDGGSLSAALPAQVWALSVQRNQLYQFELSASASSAAQVQMDVYDASGKDLFTLRATSTLPPVTGHVYLTAGTYSVRFTEIAQGGGAMPAVDFSLIGEIITDPISPRPDTGISATTSPGGNTTTGGPGGQTYYA